MECNDKLEERAKTVSDENDQLVAKKNTLTQKLKIVETELEAFKNREQARDHEIEEDSGTLKIELEQLKITNTVYMEKIEELIEEMNRNKLEDNEKIDSLKKKNEQLVYKLHVFEEKGSQVEGIKSSKLNMDGKSLE